MAMHSSSIDELLLGGQPTPPPAQQPESEIDAGFEMADEEITPQNKAIEPEGGYSEEDLSSYDKNDDDLEESDEYGAQEESETDETDELSETGEDEYGNKKEILSKSMQKRLERQAESMRRKYEAELAALRAQLTPSQSQQVQQAAQDFQHDPNAEADWQQQLAEFVEKTVQNLTAKQQRAQEIAQQQAAENEYREKFQQGMERFTDFVDVVGHQPVTDAMVTATRGMKDPAAFLYAASKRAPQELERIAKIRDPFVQMSETIRLEERLKKAKPASTAPKPLQRTKEDAPVKSKKTVERDDSIENLIAQADARRLAQRNSKIKR